MTHSYGTVAMMGTITKELLVNFIKGQRGWLQVSVYYLQSVANPFPFLIYGLTNACSLVPRRLNTALSTEKSSGIVIWYSYPGN